MKLFPHRVLDDDHVQWGEWRVVTSDSSELLLDQLKGWDYQQPLDLQVTCQINVAAACEQLGVEADELFLLATVDCQSTARRFVGMAKPASTTTLRRVDSDYEDWERWLGAGGEYYVGYWHEGRTWAVTDDVDVVLDEAGSHEEALASLRRIDGGAQESWQALTCGVEVPRESVAKRLDLAVQFVIMPRGSSGHGPGARVLGGPSKRTLIEGDGARFPTEPVSFKAMNWPPALWRVKFSFDSPEDAFGGAVRLFVNVDHPGSSSLLDPQSTGGHVTRAFLRQDIVRVVLTTLAQESRGSGALIVSPGGDDSSVIAVANALAHEWLKLDVEEAIMLVERSPEEFETRLQAVALDLGKKVFS